MVGAVLQKLRYIELACGMGDLTVPDKLTVEPDVEAGGNALKIQKCARGSGILLVGEVVEVSRRAFNLLLDVAGGFFLFMLLAVHQQQNIVEQRCNIVLVPIAAQLQLLNDYAESLHISTNWFIHNFKQYAGMSPAQYNLSLRMVNAQSLLERTTYNIKEISEIVGYENPLYFSRVFKKEIGKSPAQYRKEMIPTEAV